ncbi:MAG TPA: Ig-like domain-containing protein [Gammaproteobacteria bacterium]|nr:Ig-like domain-containing protein [Gammaproteobacteria bacterium]
MNKSLVLGLILVVAFAHCSVEAAMAPAPASAAPPAAPLKPVKHKKHAPAPAASTAVPVVKAPTAATNQPAEEASLPGPAAAVVVDKAAGATKPTVCVSNAAKHIIVAGEPFTLTLEPASTKGASGYTISTAPAHGALGDVSVGGQVQYTPADGYAGADTFSYTVDGTAQSPESITVCPAAVSGTWRDLDTKSATTGLLTGKGSDLTYMLLDELARPQTSVRTDHGTVMLYPRTGQFTYTPAPGGTTYVGPDSFDFQVQTGKGDSVLTSAKATETVIRGSWPPCESVESYMGRDSDALAQMIQPNGASYNPVCVNTVNEALRRKAFLLTKQIAGLQGFRTQLTGDKDLKANSDQIQADVHELQKIENLGISPSDLTLRFLDYPQWYAYFFGGMAFTSIDKLFQNGSPMIGFSVDHRFAPWFHAAGTIEVTSAAESQLSQTMSTPGLPAVQSSSQTSGHNALDANLEPYFSFKYGSDSEPGYAGPILLFGLRKRDGDSHFTYRRYLLGVRDAINPDTYFDLLVGQTMGLDGTRVELRTQMPLPLGTFNNESRFFIGAVANVHWKSSSADDSLVIYLTWNLPFQKIIGVPQGAAAGK